MRRDPNRNPNDRFTGFGQRLDGGSSPIRVAPAVPPPAEVPPTDQVRPPDPVYFDRILPPTPEVQFVSATETRPTDNDLPLHDIIAKIHALESSEYKDFLLTVSKKAEDLQTVVSAWLLEVEESSMTNALRKRLTSFEQRTVTFIQHLSYFIQHPIDGLSFADIQDQADNAALALSFECRGLKNEVDFLMGRATKLQILAIKRAHSNPSDPAPKRSRPKSASTTCTSAAASASSTTCTPRSAASASSTTTRSTTARRFRVTGAPSLYP